ncbi:UDP-glucuronosyltransferase 2B20 [Folsomia candida]|uniref:UDP-glucuronosyltransferase 2B1 n=1 Tax=Folsomia candida TaxID=158441 RepID=A0A226EIB1_FOLCA|nr:UDP-glucuronosyltransferase 2B20 [Folsomia candida]XP_035706156.1 UDP-glucuronosyltransferase 2B20 [Folsomia candida]OXA57179.1 UDP-glucuronosyltransferase 2B1 [Folsomia candida]
MGHFVPVASSLFIIVVAFTQIASAERILFILPLATRSETHLFTPLAKELALKGHNITFVTPSPSNIKLNNFKEIVPIAPFVLEDFDNVATDPIESRRRSRNKLAWIMSFEFQFIFDGCHAVFNNPEFQALLEEQFDLLIISSNFNNCFDGLVHKFQAPFISMSSMPVSGFIAQMTGMRMPPSFVPNPMLEFSDDMTFWQRLVNSLMTWTFNFLFVRVVVPSNTEIYRKYLGQDYPDVAQIESGVSMIFSNSHFSINSPRPVFPDIVEIGGIHCRGAEPLPQNLDEWLSAAPEGFIFFSLGSVIKGVTLPEETRKMFLNVFSRLKQRVLWKFESEQMTNLPANVKLNKWLSQQDVLGHKNIKLFISHGGLLSTQESTYHGVPILGIPFAVDQDVNMLQTEKLGFSLTLEIMDLTEEKLEVAINYILKNSTYADNAKQAAKIFRDRAESPLKTAVFWTEYVLRHKGASQLRSTARKLTTFQYHSFDIIMFLVITVLVFILILVQLFRLCWCRKSTTDKALLKKKWQ